ncbi:hypothetical protein BJY01DRAFT_215692 [Aspergillus pseudoustus]|uniref:Structure-specific endonuclease subunit SLX4 n=1 Tax=Aspergillus pseudoustus TaxID=1810923 RepID=A0ABR4JTY7_9EURO
MHSDLIILSSSPERNAICTPPPLAAITEKRQQRCARAASLSPIPSPTEMLRGDPLRSKFFVTSDQNQPKTKGIKTKTGNTAAANPGTTNSSTTQGGNERKLKAVQQVAIYGLDSADVGTEDNAPPKPRRTRKKRTDGATGGEKTKNKTISGKVAKPRTRNSNEIDTKPVDCPPTPKQTRKESSGMEDLQLELALKRRVDWTPTKELSIRSTAPEVKDNTEGGQSKLGSLLSGYEYDQVNTIPHRLGVLGDEGPTKRRRIELVDSDFLAPKSNLSNNDSASNKEANFRAGLKLDTKPKARPKRLTTLTARVTAPYLEPATFTVGETLIAPDKPKSKADATSGLKIPTTIVLSPEAALKSLDNQDLLFGTCSQLERADSPTMLRDTQIALQESGLESASASSSHHRQGKELAQSTNISCLTKPSRNLWAVAARDSEGFLKDVEVIELLDTPETFKTINISDAEANQEGGQNEAHETNYECDMLPVKAQSPDAPFCAKGSHASTTQAYKPTSVEANVASKCSMPNYNGFTDIELAKKIKRNGLKAIKGRKKMIEVLEKCWTAQHGGNNHEQGDGSQTAEDRSTTQDTAKYRPQIPEKKPRKPRTVSQKKKEQPKSGSSKVVTTKEDNTTTTLSKTSQPATQPDTVQDNETNLMPNQKPNQPSSTRSFIDIDEIQDSEDELLPSPSQLQIQLFGLPREGRRELPTSATSSPSPSRPTSRLSCNGTSPSITTLFTTSSKDNADEKLLFELGGQITKAVRAQPRQSQKGPSSSRPSWHEKILMYDPIYLEDFTAWLNTEGLGLVNEDREVGAGLVRRWCESKGICCCYKVKNKAGNF